MTPYKIITSQRTSVWEIMRLFGRYHHLFGLLIWRNVNIRYKQASIGLAWAVLQPLVTCLIFTIIFGHLAHLPADGLPYGAFAFCGVILWRFFAQSVEGGMISIVMEENLIRQVYFPRWILPLAQVGGSAIDFAISLVVLVFVLVFYGISPGWRIVFFLPSLLLLVILTASVSAALGMICCKYRDFRFLVTFALQLFQFVTPVFYSLSLFDESLQIWAYFNPLAGIFELFRLSVTGQSHWLLTGFVLSLAMNLLVIFLSLKIVYLLEDELIDVI